MLAPGLVLGCCRNGRPNLLLLMVQDNTAGASHNLTRGSEVFGDDDDDDGGTEVFSDNDDDNDDDSFATTPEPATSSGAGGDAGQRCT